jgi:C1A family cysteine protease
MKLIAGAAAVMAVIGYLSLSQKEQPGMNLFATSHKTMKNELEQEFVNFIAKFGKSYSSKDEIPKRFATFSEKYLKIKEHNSRPDAVSKMAINQFADMTSEELPKGLQIDQEALLKLELPKLESKSLEQSSSKDWRSASKIAPVLNQGTCGSCWAFSGTNVLESALAIANGYSISSGSPSNTISI